jgi:recombination protein RecR
MSDTHSLETLIQALRRLPGVGVKSASRMAFYLLQHDRDGAQILAQALLHAATRPSPLQPMPHLHRG